MLLQCGLHPLQRVGLNKGRITVKYHGHAVEALQRRTGLGDRMGGAKLLLLFDDDGFGVMGQGGGTHHLGTVTRDNDGVLGLKHAAGFHRVDQHRLASDGVQDLGQVRIHPCAFAGTQNN